MEQNPVCTSSRNTQIIKICEGEGGVNRTYLLEVMGLPAMESILCLFCSTKYRLDLPRVLMSLGHCFSRYNHAVDVLRSEICVLRRILHTPVFLMTSGTLFLLTNLNAAFTSSAVLTSI